MPDPGPVRGHLALSALGLGHLRPGPGTWASTATAAVVAGAEFGGGAGLVAAIGLTVLGTAVTLVFGSIRSPGGGHTDPPWVVSDEVAGQGLACLGALLHGTWPVGLLVALLAFRLLDIAKPGPIGRLQRLPGGVGVLADDLAAGLGAGLLALAASAASITLG